MKPYLALGTLEDSVLQLVRSFERKITARRKDGAERDFWDAPMALRFTTLIDLANFTIVR
jgi:hypothetical protein